MIAMTALTATDKLIIYSGKNRMTLKPADQAHYSGERGRARQPAARAAIETCNG